MKKLIAIISTSVMMLCMSASYAEVQFGVALQTGNLSTSGTETEGTAADTSNRSKSFDEFFVGADIFIEHVSDNGLTLGLSYVPLDIEIGSGKRTDSDGDDPAENDDGTRTASADVSDLITLYTNVPMGTNGWYGLLGAHFTTITTSETLPNSSYGDEDIMGLQVGFGKRDGNAKIELAYSDFEDISISSTGGNTNKVTADADALTLRFSYGF